MNGYLRQGRGRQYEIVRLLCEFRVLSTNQVQLLLFNNASAAYNKWKARERLRKWYDTGLIKRGRCNSEACFVYWLEQRPEHIEHSLMINWVYVYLSQTGCLSEFVREYPCGDTLCSDAYLVHRGKPYFLEVQRLANRTPFAGKVRAYCNYAESLVWQVDEWPGGNQFAKILVVCEAGKGKYETAIKKENRLGLRFQVLTLEELEKNPGCIEVG